MKKYGVGLFVGRFQPLHRGHMHALEQAAASCTKLIIAIGSSQESGTRKNPLPVSARAKIIRVAISGSGVGKRVLRFVRVPDFKDDDAWFNYIRRRVPKFDVVFSGDPVTKRIFRHHGVTVRTPSWYRRRALSGTRVRRRIILGRGWQRLVPRKVIRDIEAYEGAIRRSGAP